MQLASAYSGIVNEGKIYKPFVVQKLFYPEKYDSLSQPVQQVHSEFVQKEKVVTDLSKLLPKIQPEHYRVVKEGLSQVIAGNHGTARWWKLSHPFAQMAGKTGTAQVVSRKHTGTKCENRPLKQRSHGWFVGYAPLENPQIIVSVLAKHTCHGGSGAAPIAKYVIERYFKKNPPSLPKEKSTSESSTSESSTGESSTGESSASKINGTYSHF